MQPTASRFSISLLTFAVLAAALLAGTAFSALAQPSGAALFAAAAGAFGTFGTLGLTVEGRAVRRTPPAPVWPPRSGRVWHLPPASAPRSSAGSLGW